MGVSLANLPETAQTILTVFAQQLEADGVTLPPRQYVHPGTEPVWDGPQLTCGLIDVKQGQPGGAVAQNVQPQMISFFGEFRVVLIRAAPTLGDGPMVVPSDDDLQAAALEALQDIAALTKAFSVIHLGNLIASTGEGFVMQACRSLADQGGLLGSELLLDLSLR